MTRQACICVPARNEAHHIGILMEALTVQDVDASFRVALCVNNSDDDTADIARDVAKRAGNRLRLSVEECSFEPALAHAGSARRAAMNLGARIMDEGEALLLSTDADCRPPANWLAANLAAAAADDRVIGGRIELDEAEASDKPAIFELRRRFDAYWRAVRAIEDSLDPLPWDPAPRHGDHTGASLALSVGLYRRSGGVPLLPTGEDRALVDAALAVGGKLVHPLTVWTRTSSRTLGRAAGGMACDLQSWIDTVDRGDTPLVPSFAHWETRARWRREQREASGAAALREAEDGLPAMPCDMMLPEGLQL